MLTKITKREARKLWEQEQDFIMCASNLRPDMFGCHSQGICTELDFDGYLDIFKYYNCTSAETGKRVAFYKEV